VLDFLGLTAFVLGWYGASNVGTVREQIPWADLSVVGLLLVVTGQVAWILAGRRALEHRSRAICRASDDILSPLLTVTSSATDAGRARAVKSPGPDAGLVTAAGLTRYHRVDCLLIAGRDARPADPALIAGRRLRPCSACQPVSGSASSAGETSVGETSAGDSADTSP
jgi:hypothetical protein